MLRSDAVRDAVLRRADGELTQAMLRFGALGVPLHEACSGLRGAGELWRMLKFAAGG